MRGDEVTDAARRLVHDHIDSMGRLDLLLVMYQDPATGWTAERMAKQMRASVRWVRAQMEALSEAGLARRADGTDEAWCFDPRDERTAAAAQDLVTACRLDWTAVTKLVMDQRPSGAQAFSDAFRVRRKSDG